jgi:hypothetical protein
MAVDTERKRWSMLQWASGPSYYPTLFNPDTSGIDATERATVLKLYGGIAWDSPVEVEPEPEVAQPSGGWIRQQDEESTGQRKARILKERIDLGIIAAPELPVIALKATGPNKRQVLALDERERLLTHLEAMAEQDAQRDNLRRKHTALLLLLL